MSSTSLEADSSSFSSNFCDFESMSVPESFVSHHEHNSRSRRSLPASNHKEPKPQVEQVSDSDGSDDEDEELFQQVDMAALSNRGKGNHVCPKRFRCTKGGVDKNGQLVYFERNSSFV